MVIKALAPAKINPALKIEGKRDDGYHNIDTIFQSVSIYDSVSVRKVENKGIKVVCNKILDCNEEDNIAYKVAKKFFDYNNIIDMGIIIEIDKKIPICAGLAGGSSDGAAVAVILNKMFETNLNNQEIKHIVSEVGSDIPFCVSGGTARAVGTGTNLCKITSSINYGIALVKPKCSISTKKAYDLYDANSHILNANNNSVDNVANFIKKGELKNFSMSLFNDFEKLVSNKEIIETKKQILKYEPLELCMSGSGPSVFAIFKNFELAKECVKGLKSKYNDSFACIPIDNGIKII